MYYVTMIDKFFSGWGMAENKYNRLVFICETYDEAVTVANNAKARGDQKRVNITQSKPHYSPSTNYTQYKTIDDYPEWYKPGYFKKGGAE